MSKNRLGLNKATNLFPRAKVLKSLYDLTERITSNRFIDKRPNATGAPMENFLLIHLDEIKNTADTYQLSRGRISVFARDIQGTDSGGNSISGMENTVSLDQLQNAVTALFPIRTDLYLATRPTLLPGGSDGAGFHSLIIQFNIRIHKDFDIHPRNSFTL